LWAVKFDVDYRFDNWMLYSRSVEVIDFPLLGILSNLVSILEMYTAPAAVMLIIATIVANAVQFIVSPKPKAIFNYSASLFIWLPPWNVGARFGVPTLRS